MNDGFRQSRRETANGFSHIWLRYLGIILPAVVNYGFFIVHGDRPHWAALGASAGVMAVSALILGLWRDWRGGVSVIVLFFPLNAWPIVLTTMGGLHD